MRPFSFLTRLLRFVSGRASLLGVAGLLLAAFALAAPGNGSLWRLVSPLRAAPPHASETPSDLERFSQALTRAQPVVDEPATRWAVAMFAEVLRRTLADYVRPLDSRTLVDQALDGLHKEAERNLDRTPRSLLEAALDAMLLSLDPYSAYLDPKDYRDMETQIRGQFGGLGVEVSQDKDSGFIKVVSPIDDTPAARAGLSSGDLITHLDGQSVHGMNLTDAVSRMRGQAGTQIRLTVQRNPDKNRFDVTLTRAIIRIQAVRWRTEGDAGYIRLTTFNNKQTVTELTNAVTALRREKGSRLTGLILDLRNNPGGLLDQAVAVSDLFLERGLIVSIRGRKSGEAQDYLANSGDIARGLPMVVLINNGSASASEIVAAALQDYQRATIFGTRSFGKGLVQTISPLTDDGALRLTTARYYRPSQKSVDCLGVVPNLQVRPATASQNAEAGDEDERQKSAYCEDIAPPPPPSRILKLEETCPASISLLFPPEDKTRNKDAKDRDAKDRDARTPPRPLPPPAPGSGKENDALVACAVEALKENLRVRF